MSWTCNKCTWLNTNGLVCSMCNTERVENNGSGEPSTSQQVGGNDIPVSSIEDNTQPCNINDTHKSVNTGAGNNNDESLQQFDNIKQQPAPSQEEEEQADIKRDGTSKDGGGKKKKWDAFASLQSNYESSDDDDDSADDGSNINKDKEEVNDSRRGQRNNNNNAGWNAFASFEQNYESSDESESGSDDDSEEGEESEGCSIEDEEHYGDLIDSEDEKEKESSLKINSIVECVDLLDSEDEEQDDQREEDDNSVCELDVKMPAGKDMTGKENNKSDKKRRSRVSKRSPPKHPEAYTIDIGDSDSELSEVESRPLPSPELARQQRQIPSWQRRRSTPIQASNGFNLKNASDYACMNGRNDVTGGSGTGVNGVRLAKKKGDDTTTTTGTKRKSGGRRKRRATSLPGLSMTTETTTSKPTTKRRRKTTASKTTSSKAKAPKAKGRRKRSYKRRSTKRRGGNANAWAARERGVRGGQRRGNTGSAAPYMAIAKQEPLLANIGGASIQF